MRHFTRTLTRPYNRASDTAPPRFLIEHSLIITYVLIVDTFRAINMSDIEHMPPEADIKYQDEKYPDDTKYSAQDEPINEEVD